MKHLLTFYLLLVALCIASPAQSWDIYNSPGEGGEVDFSNITSAVGITFDATDNMDIDASTTNHTSTDGVIDIILTPSAPSTRGMQITIDANGQNDTMAHNVTYIANDMEVGDIGMAMEININPGTATGGEVEGLRVTRTGINGIDVHAIHAGTGVAPMMQNSGAPTMMDIAFLYNSSSFINATTAFRNDSSTLNYTLVPNTNDYIYIGHATTFSEVEIILATNADTSIVPVFEYYTGGWTVFGPNDSTAGLTTDGAWSWDSLADWTTTTVNGITSKYWIRVQRTAAVTTDAVEKTIDILIPTEYSWGKTGDITAYDMMLQGTYGAGDVLDVSGAGTRCFFYPKKAAFRCGNVVSSQWDEGSIGPYSFAVGLNTTASGNYSHAEGSGTTAANNFAHAEGGSTTASASNSHAEGASTLASGNSSHAEGSNTTASGNYSHAAGFGTRASGTYSHAGGINTIAAATRSFVYGDYLSIGSAAVRSVMFGSYANSTERDTNVLIDPNTMKLANMDLVVDGSATFSGEVSFTKTYANISNTVDQTFAGTGTGYALLFNSNDNLEGITHSTSVATENITIVTDGIYSINAQPQVTAGAAGDFHMWMQVDTGGGFADVTNSNVKLSLAINNEGVIPLTLTIPLDTGDIVRLMGSVSNTGVILDATAPGGEPVIPAIILSMHKI